jgi:hypothetical protein
MEKAVRHDGKRPLSEKLGITSVTTESIAWTVVVVSKPRSCARVALTGPLTGVPSPFGREVDRH